MRVANPEFRVGFLLYRSPSLREDLFSGFLFSARSAVGMRANPKFVIAGGSDL